MQRCCLQETGGGTLESGGITIKFKPPPAGRQQAAQDREAQQRQAASGASAAAAGLERDEAVPGIDIRVKALPPPLAAQQQEQQLAAASPQPATEAPWATAAQQAGLAHMPASALQAGHQPGGAALPGGNGQPPPPGPPPQWQQHMVPPPAMPPPLPAWPAAPPAMLADHAALLPPWALPPLAPAQPPSRSVAPPPWGTPGAPRYLLSPLEQQQQQQQQQQWAAAMPLPPGGMPYSLMAVGPPPPQWMQPHQAPLGAGMPGPHQLSPQQQPLLGYGGGTLPPHPSQQFPWSHHPQQPFGPSSAFSPLPQQGFGPGPSFGPGPPQHAAAPRPQVPHFETSSVLSLSDSPADRWAGGRRQATWRAATLRVNVMQAALGAYQWQACAAD